jgi:hypothetical protein
MRTAQESQDRREARPNGPQAGKSKARRVNIQDGQALIVTRARATAGRLCKDSTDPTIGARDDVGTVQGLVLQVASCPAGGPTLLPDDLHDHTRIPSDTGDLGLVITAKAAAGLLCSTGTIRAVSEGWTLRRTSPSAYSDRMIMYL